MLFMCYFAYYASKISNLVISYPQELNNGLLCNDVKFKYYIVLMSNKVS